MYLALSVARTISGMNLHCGGFSHTRKLQVAWLKTQKYRIVEIFGEIKIAFGAGINCGTS